MRHYLDHASTSFPKPPAVWEAFERQAREVGAPAGRSASRHAARTDQSIARARGALARLFDARPEHVVFTLNATDALNIAIKGVVREGDRVVTTCLEHNSVVRPLATLERERGVQVTRLPASSEGVVDPTDLERALRDAPTRLVVMLHASNVSGAVQPVRAAAHAAREHGALFLLDAAQTAGSLPISLLEDGIDLVAVPGHKGLLGPAGTGALVIADGIDVRPLREGGTGSRSEDPEQPRELPDRLECGTPNAPGIAALGAGVEWLQQRGLGAVRADLETLMRRLQDGLDAIGGVRWLGPRDVEAREPVYPVLVEGYAPAELAAALDAAFEVETRAGLHCAPGAHRAIGTFPEGTCRVSLGAMSTAADVDAALEALAALAGGRG